ncbi:RNA polymerase I specific transcription initiation factor RRN3 superfamily [Apiospora marii]|uniref:RNA polymerase I specific transcription initiation factor RRN3 superfamily n=1 Tax=Apiospora marii TaxID=335849 RepID=A0ABR1SFI4_9PEZI
MQSAVATTTTATQLAHSAAKSAAKAATTPLKPILKSTSSLLGKRKGSEDDNPPSDASSTDHPQSPRKRQRVEFDMNLEIHEVGARTVDEIKKEISKALDGHAQGDDEDYDILKEAVAGRQRVYDADEDDEDEDKLPEKQRQELKGYMVALTGFVPHLGRSASGLVKSVLRCQWLGRDDQFATVYTQFLGALVSAQGSYLNLVLEMLVDKFSNSRPADWAVPGFPTVTRERMQDRLHQAVRYLLRVFPAANVVLGQVIVSKFPYHDNSSRVHLAYVDNLLRLRKYASQLQTDITDLITNRLVHIDVKMQMDMDDLDDRLTAMVLMALRSAQANGELAADDEDEESDAESVDSDDDEEDEFNQIKSVKESIEKLDVTLDRLFKLYTPYFEDPDSAEALATFEMLLNEFSHIILPAYKSRHTQFLVFHFAQQSETLLDLFCGTLINTAFESNRPLVLRQAASAYLASFVARGAMVPGKHVRLVFEVLGHHLDKMRATYEVNCRGPDVRRYAPFYSLTQALMYIFCFRWRDLIQEVPEDVDEDELSSYLDQDITWIPEVKEVLRRNIYSKLNPLKVCSPAIVEQFAPLAHRMRFMYVYPLIESNKRLRLSQFVSTAYANGGALRESGLDLNDESWQQLDSYFPFDPYQLPTSKHWVEGDYLPWRNIPGLNPDEEEDSDEEEELVEEEIDEDTATDDEDGRDD